MVISTVIMCMKILDLCSLLMYMYTYNIYIYTYTFGLVYAPSGELTTCIAPKICHSKRIQKESSPQTTIVGGYTSLGDSRMKLNELSPPAHYMKCHGKKSLLWSSLQSLVPSFILQGEYILVWIWFVQTIQVPWLYIRLICRYIDQLPTMLIPCYLPNSWVPWLGLVGFPPLLETKS